MMNLSALTFKQLRVFAVVARLGTLTAAAQELSLTKAALSIALHELEKQLGRSLFDRVKNRLIINHYGLQLRPLADELLHRAATIDQLFEQGSLAGSLAIGASFTVGEHLLPLLVGRFMQHYHCLRPELVVENTTQLCRDLESYQLDVALVEGAVASSKLVALPWQQDEMVIIAAPRHALARGASLDVIELNGEAWVMREQASGTREQFDRRMAPLLERWSLALEFNSNTAVINAVASGIGIAFMSNLAAADALACGRIVRLNIDRTWTRQLHLVYVKEKYQSPLVQTFIEFALS